MKIVLNKCYGGFGLSVFACMVDADSPEREMFFEQGNAGHEKLAALIEKYGTKALNGEFANLEVYEIPDDVTDWEIDEYDGWESLLYVRNGKIYRE